MTLTLTYLPHLVSSHDVLISRVHGLIEALIDISVRLGASGVRQAQLFKVLGVRPNQELRLDVDRGLARLVLDYLIPEHSS